MHHATGRCWFFDEVKLQCSVFVFIAPLIKKTIEQINKKKVKQNKCHVKMFAYAHSPVHSYPLNLNAIDVTAI